MYDENCEGCKLSRGRRLHTGGIIPMEGNWILNHNGDERAFLGWLVLQPRFHRMDLANLEQEEASTLGGNIQKVDKVLREYWTKYFFDDPIERTYVVYFFESAFAPSPQRWHMHIHLIPRTKKLGTDGWGKYKPWEVAAWNIAKLVKQGGFPKEYRIRNHKGEEIHEKEVMALMQYLKECLASTS